MFFVFFPLNRDLQWSAIIGEKHLNTSSSKRSKANINSIPTSSRVKTWWEHATQESSTSNRHKNIYHHWSDGNVCRLSHRSSSNQNGKNASLIPATSAQAKKTITKVSSFGIKFNPCFVISSNINSKQCFWVSKIKHPCGVGGCR